MSEYIKHFIGGDHFFQRIFSQLRGDRLDALGKSGPGRRQGQGQQKGEQFHEVGYKGFGS